MDVEACCSSIPVLAAAALLAAVPNSHQQVHSVHRSLAKCSLSYSLLFTFYLRVGSHKVKTDE